MNDFQIIVTTTIVCLVGVPGLGLWLTGAGK